MERLFQNPAKQKRKKITLEASWLARKKPSLELGYVYSGGEKDQ
jgi:hypothetical protein